MRGILKKLPVDTYMLLLIATVVGLWVHFR